MTAQSGGKAISVAVLKNRTMSTMSFSPPLRVDSRGYEEMRVTETRHSAATVSVDDVNMRSYASLLRDLMPMDDDLDMLGAPVEAIRMVEDLYAVCAADFEARYGFSFLAVPVADAAAEPAVSPDGSSVLLKPV